MDLQIAAAFNLSPELVWFSRQSYAEEVSSFPHSDQEWSGDDFTHALFMQEQLILAQDESFGKDLEIESQRRLPSRHGQQTPPPELPMSPIKPIAASSPRDNHKPAKLDIDNSLSPTHRPSPLRCDSSPLPDEAVPRPYGSGRRRPETVLPWQRAILRQALVSRSGNRPGREQLRELAQRTHLPGSVVTWWFAEQRRINYHRAKFGFFLSGPTARSAPRTVKIYAAAGQPRRH